MVFSAAGIVTNNCGGALVGFGSYCYGRYIYDIGVRSVVTKVPVEEIPKMAKEN